MKKKVLHVINSMQSGGAEILLVNSLAKGGLCDYTENYLAYFMAPSYLLDNLDKDVHVHFLDYKGFKDVARLIRQIRRIIMDNKIDIVHSHLNPASLYSQIACPKNVLHIHTIHTTYSMNKEQPKFKLWMEKYFFLMKKKANVILLSDFTKNDFLSVVPFKGKAFVLNNFVPDQFFDVRINKQQPPLKKLKLIALGTLKSLKNFEYLLEAFKYLKNYNISLDIFGGGNKEPYEDVIKENELNVRMMGHIENLKDILPGYDLFIMPSKFEGFPLAAFEAMAAGLPLMLSDIKPLKNIVKENALYFPLDNAKNLAQQLIDVLQNKININDMADKATLYAEKTVRKELYIKRLLEIYSQI